MKWVLCLLSGLAIGYGLQRAFREDLSEIEYRASLAWNEKNLAVAEQLSRAALGRNPESTRAQDILRRISDVLGRPEIRLAMQRDSRSGAPADAAAFAELGATALTANWLRVADGFLAEGVKHFPDDERLQRQYASLAGLRLNADQMQSRLVNWQSHGTPPLDLVAMAIGLYALDGRGVAPAETWLRAAVEADANDLESRLGLARCLLATGRYQQCVVLLEPVRDSDRARSLLVIAHVTMNDLSMAEALLPGAEPAEDRADYWYARGLLALERRDLVDAEASLNQAVSLRPLSPSYRSRYCDVLRRLDETDRHDEQVRQLELVTRILQKTLLFGTTNDLSSLGELIPLCEAVGAKEAALLVASAIGPREPS